VVQYHIDCVIINIVASFAVQLPRYQSTSHCRWRLLPELTFPPWYMCVDLAMTDDTELETNAPALIRSPLNTQTNAISSVSSPKTGQRVRRKSSFVRRLDSSESVPSSHDSIFVAEYLSPLNSEDSGYKTEPWQNIDSLTQLPPADEDALPSLDTDNDENASRCLSIGNTPILYGYGTPLTTIIEQKSSSATMRTSTSTTSPTRSLIHPRSASGLSSSTASASGKSQFPSTSPLKAQFSASGMILPLGSFSSDDVDAVKLLRPGGYDADRAIGAGQSSMDCETPERYPSPINEIYAEPLRPLQPPVLRPSTPPGMPSWTAAQQRRPRVTPSVATRGWGIHGASGLLQRFFGQEPSTATPSSDPAAAALPSAREAEPGSGYGIRGPWDAVPPQRRSISTPVFTGRGVPRFRPPRSGHGVTALEMHPFARAEIMPTKSGTTDATTAARRSYGSAFAGPSNAGNETQQLNSRATGRRKPGQRVRFTPSTTDCGTMSHYTDAAPIDLPPDVGVCPHRRASSSTVQLQEVASPHAVDDISSPSRPLPDPLVNRTDHPIGGRFHLTHPSQAFPDMSATPSQGPSVPRSRCWRCRFEELVAKMGILWDSSTRWCCWYCCGIDMDELRDEMEGSGAGAGAGPRLREYATGRE